MRLEALRREVRALRDGRRRAYQVEEALRARLDEALDFRRVTVERLLRRPQVVDRLLAEAGAADEAARRHLVDGRYEDAVVGIERVESSLTRVRELGRVLHAIDEVHREVDAWRGEVDFAGTLAAAATLRIPSRLIDEAERFALAGRPRAASRLVEMTRGELWRWGREGPTAGRETGGPAPPEADGGQAAALTALASTRPRLAARLAEDLIASHRRDDDRPARRRRLLAALAEIRQKAEAAGPAARSHP